MERAVKNDSPERAVWNEPEDESSLSDCRVLESERQNHTGKDILTEWDIVMGTGRLPGGCANVVVFAK